MGIAASFAAASLIASSALGALQTTSPTTGLQSAGPQSAEHFKGKVSYTRAYDYYLYLPEDYATNRNRYPLVLFLHGSGERGTDLSKIKAHGPVMEVDRKGRKFPFILISPQCPDGERWDPRGLAALMDSVIRHYRVDRHRQYVTGLSLGGFAAYEMAALFPDRFAAIAPISGGDDPIWAPQLAKTPIYAVHGVKDPVVNFDNDQRLCDAVKAAGGEVVFTPIPDGGHDVWIAAYAGDEIYDWLLKHRR